MCNELVHERPTYIASRTISNALKVAFAIPRKFKDINTSKVTFAALLPFNNINKTQREISVDGFIL